MQSYHREREVALAFSRTIFAPGYIARVWNLGALSGLTVAGAPVEELLFAAAFGAYWSGVYDHFTWRRMESSTGAATG